MGSIYSFCRRGNKDKEVQLNDTTCHICNCVFIDEEELNRHHCEKSSNLVSDILQFIFY